MMGDVIGWVFLAVGAIIFAISYFRTDSTSGYNDSADNAFAGLFGLLLMLVGLMIWFVDWVLELFGIWV
jgi:hypothetical protein